VGSRPAACPGAGGAIVQVDRDALEKLVERLAAERVALDQEQQRLNERSEALDTALQAKDHQIADLMRQVTDLQKGLAGRDAEIDSVRTQRAAATQALQVERGRLDALNEEQRQERERLEQRAAAQERRLLEDVDRTRQELKCVTLLLADENKKAAKGLADSHEQAQSLRVQLSALIAENAGLARETLSAREELQMAHSHQEQLRKDMTDLLVDLKTRLPKEAVEPGALVKRPRTKTVLKR
jgi:chromosome segregation ATPase